jgi:undecaprenyl-diphosphatase
MAGAFALDLYENREGFTAHSLGLIAVGFVVSFVVAMIVIRAFLGMVAKHGFAPFAWWRIAVGAIGLAALTFIH